MSRFFRDNADRVPAELPEYGVGEWDHLVQGNHRAVVEVGAPAPAVCAYLPWRRRDAIGLVLLALSALVAMRRCRGARATAPSRRDDDR